MRIRTMFVALAALVHAWHHRSPRRTACRRSPPTRQTEAQKKAIKDFKEGRGYELRGPFVPLLRSPDLLMRAVGMSDYVRFKSVLQPRISELVILVVAREWTQQYEWVAHYKNALKEGLKREIADAIAEARRPDAMAEDEGIAYDFASEILRTKRISDTTWGRAVAKFGEQGTVDLLGTIGYFNFLSIVMNGARTPLLEGGPDPLKRYPD